MQKCTVIQKQATLSSRVISVVTIQKKALVQNTNPRWLSLKEHSRAKGSKASLGFAAVQKQTTSVLGNKRCFYTEESSRG